MLTTYFFWCVFFLCHVAVPAQHQHDVSYKKNTSDWPAKFCFSGKIQSPINLEENDAKFQKSIQNIDYEITASASSNYKLKFINNGHSLSVEFLDSFLKLKGIEYDSTHTAKNIHFHWGSNSFKGSEHSLNGKFYAAEGHLVTWDNKYGSFETAKGQQSDGLAVVAVFFEISSTDNPLLKEWELALSNSTLKNKNGFITLPVNPSSLVDLFLPSSRNFLRYKGSLTTPNCNENVLWTVYKQTVPISDRQLKWFKDLKLSDGSAMVNNFRPQQALNRRDVYKNYKSASHLSVSQFVFYPVVVVMAFVKLS